MLAGNAHGRAQPSQGDAVLVGALAGSECSHLASLSTAFINGIRY